MRPRCLGAVCVVAAVLSFMTPTRAYAAEAYEERWDAGDANGWIQNTVPNSVGRTDFQGNPPGSLRSTWFTGDPIATIGATTELPEVSGDYTVSPLWKIDFEVFYSFGDFTDTFLRFRFQDSTFNGWRLDVADVFPASWESYSVTIDPTWSSRLAAANGWIDETGGTISWQQLMSDVYRPEIRVELGDDIRSSIQIDNFVFTPIPEPTAAALALSALACAAQIRRVAKT